MNPVRIGDATLYTGDVLAVLAGLPEESVHCVVTSPPYWGLRDYGVPGQIGLEETPEQYVAKMVEVFRAVHRVLRKDGTLWLNLGDSYASNQKGSGGPSDKQRSNAGSRYETRHLEHGLKEKDLVGIPWRVAFALQADGWYLRSDIIEEVEFYCPCGCGYIMQERIWRYSQDRDIIWKKPNPMPESVTDRPTKAHEYLFLLSKSPRYFYDAEAIKEQSIHAGETRVTTPKGFAGQAAGLGVKPSGNAKVGSIVEIAAGRNRRTVWTIPTESYDGAHFATFPRKLVQPCILAGCPEHACPKCGAPWVREVEKSGGTTGHSWHDHSDDLGRGQQKNENGMDTYHVSAGPEHPTCSCALPAIGGTVLDCFGGSGTVGEVALEYGRRVTLIELKPEYVELQKRRLAPVAGRPLLDFSASRD